MSFILSILHITIDKFANRETGDYALQNWLKPKAETRPAARLKPQGVAAGFCSIKILTAKHVKGAKRGFFACFTVAAGFILQPRAACK